ncbi:unnamed protein product [Tilletia caries]|uniref:C3H1-type domain-containing protein n=1 Tax=Tilletia caries TaxID=13290 RepID=A0ABN7IQP4_9BASI|nr:unnamed protein product [Tilletia caries]
MLHAWQRKCFAHDTRQTKTRRKKIKRSDLSDAEKSSKLDDLRQFDPAIWPSDNFKRIKKELKKRRSSAVEEELQRVKAAIAGPSNSNSGSKRSQSGGPSGTGQQSKQPSQKKSFRDEGFSSKSAGAPCSRCGSKARHNPRECMAEHLAADPTKKTFAINNDRGQCIKRDGGQRICVSYNIGNCQFPACHHMHICCLCGKDSCSAQRCSLATGAPPPTGASAQS